MDACLERHAEAFLAGLGSGKAGIMTLFDWDRCLGQMARRISPSVVIGPMSRPYVLMPVIALAQAIQVSCEREQFGVISIMPDMSF